MSRSESCLVFRISPKTFSPHSILPYSVAEKNIQNVLIRKGESCVMMLKLLLHNVNQLIPMYPEPVQVKQ